MLEDIAINKESNKYICPHCGKEYSKMGIGSHIWRSHSEKGKKFDPNKGYYDGTRVVWNKGLTKETDGRVMKQCETYRERFENGEIKIKGTKHTDEFKKKMSLIAKNNNLGGWCSSKKIPYKGVILQSSYELEFAKDLDKNNIEWERPKPLYYTLNGEKHRYYPDFYIKKLNVYADPKNDFLIEKVNPKIGICDREKIEIVSKENNVIIIILNKNELNYKSLLNKYKALIVQTESTPDL